MVTGVDLLMKVQERKVDYIYSPSLVVKIISDE
jgi:hypothetical protein